MTTKKSAPPPQGAAKPASPKPKSPPKAKAKRTYGFELPYTIPGWKVGMGLDSRFRQTGLLAMLPADMRATLERAEKSHADVTVTKAHLDALPDETWRRMAETLELDWSEEG
jgi:hypothetical protein